MLNRSQLCRSSVTRNHKVWAFGGKGRYRALHYRDPYKVSAHCTSRFTQGDTAAFVYYQRFAWKLRYQLIDRGSMSKDENPQLLPLHLALQTNRGSSATDSLPQVATRSSSLDPTKDSFVADSFHRDFLVMLMSPRVRGEGLGFASRLSTKHASPT